MKKLGGSRLRCGYSGSIDFQKDGKSLLQELIVFNLHCFNIVIVNQNEVYRIKLTDEGLASLKALQNNIP